MFEIDENNLPIVRTRRALVAIDLQNDLVSAGGLLHVNNPPHFVKNIVDVASKFREHGNVIWVKTVFEGSRAVNLAHGDSEKVITDKELVSDHPIDEQSGRGRARPSRQLLDGYNKVMKANRKAANSVERGVASKEEKDEISEAYLTLEDGEIPQIFLPASPGTNITPAVAVSIVERDLVFQKSHYSAFKDGSLIQIMRAKFVTEIYICGALTNISVFATAMDAARYGYAITILDDCLGYRSKARHDIALSTLSEFTGCNIISSSKLIDGLKRTSTIIPASTFSKLPSQRDTSIEKLLSDLQLKPRASADSSRLAPDGDNTTVLNRIVPLPMGAVEIDRPAAKPVDAEGQKRERVKTKIKTRRRPGNPIVDSSQKLPAPLVSKTKGAASFAIDKSVDTKGEATGVTCPSEAIKNDQQTLQGRRISVENDITGTIPNDKCLSSASGVSSSDSSGPTSSFSSSSPSPSSAPPTGSSSEPICEGDTMVIRNLVNHDIADSIFSRLREEVMWQRMAHRGNDVPRLIAVQGETAEDGSIPVSGFLPKRSSRSYPASK